MIPPDLLVECYTVSFWRNQQEQEKAAILRKSRVLQKVELRMVSSKKPKISIQTPLGLTSGH
jgi:hypothetical protein